MVVLPDRGGHSDIYPRMMRVILYPQNVVKSCWRNIFFPRANTVEKAMFCTILSNLGLAKPDSSNASSGVPLLATKIKVYRDLLTVSTGSRVACITTLLFLMLECGAGAHIRVCRYL